jgi:hypothetical protein
MRCSRSAHGESRLSLKGRGRSNGPGCIVAWIVGEDLITGRQVFMGDPPTALSEDFSFLLHTKG